MTMAMSAPLAIALIVVPVICDVISAAPAIIACSAGGPPWKNVDSSSMPWRGRNPSSWAMIGSTCGALRDGKERLIVTGAGGCVGWAAAGGAPFGAGWLPLGAGLAAGAAGCAAGALGPPQAASSVARAMTVSGAVG